MSVMAGWLATMTLQSDVSIIDFVIAIAGAGVAAAVAALVVLYFQIAPPPIQGIDRPAAPPE